MAATAPSTFGEKATTFVEKVTTFSEKVTTFGEKVTTFVEKVTTFGEKVTTFATDEPKEFSDLLDQKTDSHGDTSEGTTSGHSALTGSPQFTPTKGKTTMSKSKAAPHASSVHPAKAHVVPKTPTRTRTPSVTTSLLAATVADHPPVVQIPVATGDPPVTTSATQPSGLPPVTAASNPIPQTATSKTPSIPGVADVAPSVTLPTVPDTFVALPRTGVRGYYPSQREVAAMPGALDDLGRFTDYATVLGTSAASCATLSTCISQSIRWRKLRNASEAWDAYVRAQDALAWRTTVTLLDKVRPLFLLATTENPALATEYPRLAQLFDVGRVVAKQALATKAKNAKVKAANDATAAQTATETATTNAISAATAAANAATEAANKVASVTTTPPKAVTVNT